MSNLLKTVLPSSLSYSQMAYIDNSKTKQELNDAIRGNSVSNISPHAISSQVMPVININPKDYQQINIVKERSSSGTIYTTPTDKDFYIVAIHMQGSSAVVGLNTFTVSATIFGDSSATVLNSISQQPDATITSTLAVSNLTLPLPLKLARGTNITNTLANTSSFRAVIYGYIVD